MAVALEANKTLEVISVGNVIVGSTVKLKSSGELKVLTSVHSDGDVEYEGSYGWVNPSTFEPIPAVLPLKKLRDNIITELDLNSSGLGVDGGMMLAAVLKSNSSVTKVSDCEWLVRLAVTKVQQQPYPQCAAISMVSYAAYCLFVVVSDALVILT